VSPDSNAPVPRYICVHGHFYQPPRENPWLEAIELQDSAYPYHDWNERITAECYAPNGGARILGENQRITRLVNNYASVSFNFGPTLISWLEASAPRVYKSILDADKQSAEKFGGHGSAMAQGYNHMILPLANRRDKVTQVKWGIEDFKHRFGRVPEGMWLPETAVDNETLEVLAENAVKFTILAPRQASRVRRFGSRSWKDVSGDKIDPSRAYLCRLPSRKTIALFFYDGPISQAIAFEGLLSDGKRFAERLVSGFSDARTWPQLCHVATDGESYGHHHPFGDMALAYALEHIGNEKLAQLTNYGQFLDEYPPDHFVDIFQNSSWSCAHGVERWRANCGCNSGGHGDWNQEWRAPLRGALDWLRDSLAPLYEKRAAELLKDPWRARDEYIRVILDRSDENLRKFFGEHGTHELNADEMVPALKLLEMQRHLMLMYTSCGWFFDELSGLETVQVIQYAGRALQLGQELFGDHLEEQFLERLRAAKSNLPEHGDGANIYEKWVKTSMLSMAQVGAHYAISSLFETYREETQIYCYDTQREDFHQESEGKLRLATGRARVSSQITRETARLSFAAVHLGDHNVICGVRPAEDEAKDQELKQQLAATFANADMPGLIRLVDEGYGKKVYSIRSLFRDEQRKILRLILEGTLAEAQTAYGALYESHAQLIRFLNEIQTPVPKALQAAAEMALNSQLRAALGKPEVDIERARTLLKETATSHTEVDKLTVEFVLRKRIEESATEFSANGFNAGALEKIITLLELAEAVPLHVTLWEAQNTIYAPLLKSYRESRAAAEQGNADAQTQLQLVTAVGEKIGINLS
jgi:alpha-amylase/alpha-mannosidase (GH57 family)